MPQLNVHVPASSNLLDRVDAAARQLGTTPSALARVVLDVALEPYLYAQLELRRQEQAYSSRVVASLRDRFSGALPARPFTAAGEPGEAEDAGAAADRDLDAGGEARSEATNGVAHPVRHARRTATATPSAGQRPNGVERAQRPAAAAHSAVATR
jgi:hypothetical protein